MRDESRPVVLDAAHSSPPISAPYRGPGAFSTFAELPYPAVSLDLIVSPLTDENDKHELAEEWRSLLR